MKKSLIALAVASVFIAPVAMAEATIYGLLSLSLDMNDTGGLTLNKTTTVSAPSARFGFKGTEDLGGGLSAFWQIESNVRMDDLSPAFNFGDRDSFAGLKSNSMGSLILGSGGTPYRGSTRGLDLFGSTAGSNNPNMSNGTMLDGGGTNVVAYVSPNLGGVSVTVARGFDETATAADGDGATFIAAQYKAGPIYVTVAQGTFTTGAVAETTGRKVGGSYSMGAFSVGVILEQMTATNGAAVDTTNTNTYLGGKYNISKTDAVKLAITTIGDTETANISTKNGKRNMVVGYDHKMGKNTTAYALYSKTTANAVGGLNPTALSLGLHKAF